MKNLKANATTKLFFDYSFNGNGKYYTTEQGSRQYRNTTFTNFYNKNVDCIDILEKGNDAPRGGKTGDFVIVKFNKNFEDKYNSYIDFLKNKAIEDKKVQEKFEADRKISEENAILIFEEYLTIEKKESLKLILESKNSKGRKNFLKIKSINKTNDYRNYSVLEKMIYS